MNIRKETDIAQWYSHTGQEHRPGTEEQRNRGTAKTITADKQQQQSSNTNSQHSHSDSAQPQNITY